MGRSAGWIKQMCISISTTVDDRTSALLLESCGRNCASGWASGQALECSGVGVSEEDKVDALHAKLPTLRRDGKDVLVEYDHCYCDHIKDVDEVPANFCNCSIGWVREVMEKLLQRPVEVTLEHSIIRGGSSCLFRVPLK